jgi:two-component system sensor histidine kinase CiaH
MFKKTKLRLVILNALVFLILQNAFGVGVYLYMKYSLYHQVDQSIMEKKTHLLNEREELREQLNPEREENRRLAYLLWDKTGKLYEMRPAKFISKNESKQFLTYSRKDGLQTIAMGPEHYRFITISVTKFAQLNSVQNIQIVYNLHRENEMLSHLLLVIGLGSLISVFIAILAGIYLANKALIPIKLSWEKQQRFVADASHELRTPLSVMKLNLEHLFRHPDRSIEQESETIHQSIQEINYLSRMSTDLLTLARSDADHLQIVPESVRLDGILTQTVKDFRPLAANKLVNITADVSPMSIMGDRERLKQLFVILLDNAVKYTKESGVISVQGEVKNFQAVIVISDTGIGISKENLPFIFDRYYRGDKARTRHLEGSGLGLSIAKWIIDSHSGKIRVTSKEGEGTQILISFPLKKETR